VVLSSRSYVFQLQMRDFEKTFGFLVCLVATNIDEKETK
jgi:hypothetical protein